MTAPPPPPTQPLPPVPPTFVDRLREWVQKPLTRIAAATGAGGIVLGLLIGLCAGGGGDGDAGTADTTVTTLTPVLSATDDSTTTSVPTAPTVTTAAPAGTTTTTMAVTLDRNPLTGEQLGDPTSRRIVAVKVDNVAAAMPQVGIGEAEMVIEIPVEGGITRLTALFFDTPPPVVGPVRSIRQVDAAVLAPFRPLLLTTGGHDFVRRHFGPAGVALVDLNADGAFGQIDRPRPHHVVALLELIDRLAGGASSPAGAFSFGDDFAPTGQASSISIPFSGVTDVVWRFEGGEWVRVQNGETVGVVSTFDGEPEPFTTDTVVVLQVAQRNAGYQDGSGAEVLNFDVVGFGDALVFHGGEVLEGRWLRGGQEDGWIIVDEAGTEVPLPVGRVFVEIVPRFVDVTYG